MPFPSALSNRASRPLRREGSRDARTETESSGGVSSSQLANRPVGGLRETLSPSPEDHITYGNGDGPTHPDACEQAVRSSGRHGGGELERTSRSLRTFVPGEGDCVKLVGDVCAKISHRETEGPRARQIPRGTVGPDDRADRTERELNKSARMVSKGDELPVENGGSGIDRGGREAANLQPDLPFRVSQITIAPIVIRNVRKAERVSRNPGVPSRDAGVVDRLTHPALARLDRVPQDSGASFIVRDLGAVVHIKSKTQVETGVAAGGDTAAAPAIPLLGRVHEAPIRTRIVGNMSHPAGIDPDPGKPACVWRRIHHPASPSDARLLSEEECPIAIIRDVWPVERIEGEVRVAGRKRCMVDDLDGPLGPIPSRIAQRSIETRVGDGGPSRGIEGESIERNGRVKASPGPGISRFDRPSERGGRRPGVDDEGLHTGEGAGRCQRCENREQVSRARASSLLDEPRRHRRCEARGPNEDSLRQKSLRPPTDRSIA